MEMFRTEDARLLSLIVAIKANIGVVGKSETLKES